MNNKANTITKVILASCLAYSTYSGIIPLGIRQTITAEAASYQLRGADSLLYTLTPSNAGGGLISLFRDGNLYTPVYQLTNMDYFMNSTLWSIKGYYFEEDNLKVVVGVTGKADQTFTISNVSTLAETLFSNGNYLTTLNGKKAQAIQIAKIEQERLLDYYVKVGETGTWTKFASTGGVLTATVTENNTLYFKAVTQGTDTAVATLQYEADTISFTNEVITAPDGRVLNLSLGGTTITLKDNSTKVVIGTFTPNWSPPKFLQTVPRIVRWDFENGNVIVKYAYEGFSNNTSPITILKGKDSTTFYQVYSTIVLPPTFQASTTTLTNKDVTLTIRYSGLSSVKEYRVGETGEWFSYTVPLSIAANSIVYARETSSAGVVGEIASYEVSNIDKTAPTMPTLEADKTTLTNSNVAVSITYPTDSELKQYKIGTSGSWLSYTSALTMTENNTIYARAIDAAGNVSPEGILAISNIDKTAPDTPTLLADNTAPTNGNVTVTGTYPGDAAIKQVKISSSGSWTTYSTPILLTANDTLYARAVDAAGNVSSETTLSVTNIDKTPPAAATLLASTTAPTNEHVTVTISYPADGATKQYKVGESGTWTAYTAPVVLSANDTIYARSTDAVGNMSVESTLVITNIDNVAPTVPTLVADKSTPTSSDVVVTITYPSDAAIKQVKIGSVGSWGAYSAAITLIANDTVYARAIDAAGNMGAEGMFEVSNIDKTAPAAASLSPNTAAPTNGNVTVTITYPADSTTNQVKVGAGGTWKAYTTPIVLTANDTVYARSMDAAGNTSIESSLVVSNMDKEAPAAPVMVADKTIPTSGNVVVSISYPGDAAIKEVKQGANGTWMSYTSGIMVTENTTVFARATDEAGNVSIVSSLVVNNINRTIPAAPMLVADITAPTNQRVTVMISYPTEVIGKDFRVGTGAWQAYTTPIVMTQNETLYARGTDAAGNVSLEESLTVSNIDTAAPTAPIIGILNGDRLVITPGIDQGSGVKETIFRINGENWTLYATETMLRDGQYEIDAKTIDRAGNTSILATKNVLVYAKALADATAAVEHAEDVRTKDSVEAAQSNVDKLPEVPEKEALQDRLEAIDTGEGNTDIDTKTAEDKVDEMEKLPTPDSIDKAQDAVDKLPDGPTKDALQDRIDEVKNSAEYQISIIKDPVVKNLLNGVAEAVRKAEKYMTKTYIVSALDKLTVVPAAIKSNPLYSPIVVSLQGRANKCKDTYNEMVAEQDFQSNLTKAVNAMTYYEKYKTETYRKKTQDAIALLPDNKSEKAELQAQLDTMVADFTYQDLLTKAETAIANYEQFRTATYKTKAVDAISVLPGDSVGHADKKTVLQTRLDAVIPK